MKLFSTLDPFNEQAQIFLLLIGCIRFSWWFKIRLKIGSKIPKFSFRSAIETSESYFIRIGMYNI
jgi:hypothetical protein